MAPFRGVQQEKKTPATGRRDLPAVRPFRLGPFWYRRSISGFEIPSVSFRLSIHPSSIMAPREGQSAWRIASRAPTASSRIRTNASRFTAVRSLWLFRIGSARRVIPV